MESKETIIEVVQGKINKRNQLTTLDIYSELQNKNAFKEEMYRSYYSFDKTYYDFVQKNKTVKGFDGLVYIDTITIDIDKGEADEEGIQHYVRYALDELFNFGIDNNHVNIWFSGSGYHIELLNVFGFQPSKLLHEKVRATMNEYFSFGDNIYDKTRVIRSKWSLNTKTNLYKVYIPLKDIWDMSYEDVCKVAKSKKAYNKYRASKENFSLNLNTDNNIEPYLQRHILSGKEYTNAKQQGPLNRGNTNSVVTCMQHVFNEGPSKGSRNMKLMRMASSYKRAGIPLLVSLNGLQTWANGEMDNKEVLRTVSNVYDNNYTYGCDDSIMSEYCDPKCIFFKRKDYMLDIKDVSSLEDNFKLYVQNDMTKKSINMKDIFDDCQDYSFKPGELVIFSGDTGMGKTAFVQNIVTRAKKDTLFLSLEMSEVLTWRRFVQIAWNKPKEWVYEQYKSNPDKSLGEDLKHIKIMTIAPEIEAVKKVIAQHEPNILVVDTTDELQVDRFDGEIQKQNVIIDALKGIAQRNNTTIFAIHHVNKASGQQNTIGLHSLKGSSNVVQKADKVIVLKGNRNEVYRTIVSEKSRDEGRFEMISVFDSETMTFKRYGG